MELYLDPLKGTTPTAPAAYKVKQMTESWSNKTGATKQAPVVNDMAPTQCSESRLKTFIQPSARGFGFGCCHLHTPSHR